MPKDGRTAKQWDEILRGLAGRSGTLGRGEAPPARSANARRLKDVYACPYKGRQVVPMECRAALDVFGGLIPCRCSFHKPVRRMRPNEATTSETQGSEHVTERSHPKPERSVSEDINENQNVKPNTNEAQGCEGHSKLSSSCSNVACEDSATRDPTEMFPTDASTAACQSKKADGGESPVERHLPGYLSCDKDFSRYALSLVALKRVSIGWSRGRGGSVQSEELKLFIFCPVEGGRCPSCNSASISAHAKSKVKLCYSCPWPYLIQGLQLRCDEPSCGRYWTSYDPDYVALLPPDIRLKFPAVTTPGSNCSDMQLIRMMRLGSTAVSVKRFVEVQLQNHYREHKVKYLSASEGLPGFLAGKANVAPFPPFPSHFVPGESHLYKMLLQDFKANRVALKRELSAVLCSTSLALDCQRKVVAKLGRFGEKGCQSLTAMTDVGLIANIVTLPTSGILSYGKPLLEEVRKRHDRVGQSSPVLIYLDSHCCNGVRRRGTEKGEESEIAVASRESTNSSITAREKFADRGESVKLDPLHMLLRLGKVTCCEHPRRIKLLRDLSRALLVPLDADLAKLRSVRNKLNLEGDPSRRELTQYVRRIVPQARVLETRLNAVVAAHRKIDLQQQALAVAQGRDPYPTSPADVAYPIISREWLATYSHQLAHVANDCLSDRTDILPYVEGPEVSFHGSQYRMRTFKSVRGTSHCESTHSCLDRLMYGSRGVSRSLYNVRIHWFISTFNRRRLRRFGKKMPPEGMSPLECEHYRALGAGDDYPDWSIGPPLPEEDLPQVGWDYYDRYITGPLNALWDPLNAIDEIGEVEFEEFIRLEAEPVEPAEDTSVNFDIEAQAEDEPIEEEWWREIQNMASEEALTDEALLASTAKPHSRDRKAPRLRMLGGDIACAPCCDFNVDMQQVWTEIFCTMGPRDSPATLLAIYNMHCDIERTKVKQLGEPACDLLPVTLTEVKNFIAKKRAEQAEPLLSGCLDGASRAVVSALDSELQRTVNDSWIHHHEDQPMAVSDIPIPETHMMSLQSAAPSSKRKRSVATKVRSRKKGSTTEEEAKITCLALAWLMRLSFR
ncbi:hypothetical protein FOZ63_027968, partial [Perkinsus olseni]